MTVLCALDFFVQQKHRRLGYGRKLFDCMLMHENRQPSEIPVDNPSPSFRHFLRKHFSLTTTIPQLNRFVVYIEFPFPSTGAEKRGDHRSDTGFTADICQSTAAACPVNFFQEAYEREDSLSKSSSWRVLGLDRPSHESNDLSQ